MRVLHFVPNKTSSTSIRSAVQMPSWLRAHSAEHCTRTSVLSPKNSSPASTSAKDCASAPPSRLIRLRHFAFSPTAMTPARHLHLTLCSQFEVLQFISFIVAPFCFLLVLPCFDKINRKLYENIIVEKSAPS